LEHNLAFIGQEDRYAHGVFLGEHDTWAIKWFGPVNRLELLGIYSGTTQILVGYIGMIMKNH
jgi:hypothetical protein